MPARAPIGVPASSWRVVFLRGGAGRRPPGAAEKTLISCGIRGGAARSSKNAARRSPRDRHHQLGRYGRLISSSHGPDRRSGPLSSSRRFFNAIGRSPERSARTTRSSTPGPDHRARERGRRRAPAREARPRIIPRRCRGKAVRHMLPVRSISRLPLLVGILSEGRPVSGRARGAH